MRGQGLVAYILILVLVAVVVILIASFLGPAIGNILAGTCANSQSFECKNYRVEQCLASEEYSREECIALIGGGGRP